MIPLHYLPVFTLSNYLKKDLQCEQLMCTNCICCRQKEPTPVFVFKTRLLSSLWNNSNKWLQLETKERGCFTAVATGGHSRLVSQPAAVRRWRGATARTQLCSWNLEFSSRHSVNDIIDGWWSAGAIPPFRDNRKQHRKRNRDDEVQLEKRQPPEKCPTLPPHLKLPLPSTQL